MKYMSFILIIVGILIIIFSFLVRISSINYNTESDSKDEENKKDENDLKALLDNTRFFIRIIGITITLLGIILYFL